jgi:hypothetical protein
MKKNLVRTYFVRKVLGVMGNLLRFGASHQNVQLNWGHLSGRKESWTSVSLPLH